ncbi:uncharacterized protein LOC113548360 isoform X2 [Rhopalosiphum maidis]|uniref:uncharacterized protein LOC113548360 isoform X2 n=1 Tax=Rhopalosiphum maidis TaxID=43146 RepID=UPI000EFFE732|nr:uncharacterized protein LOC113548360 isoform X2 [Rhopalosiphum maidis]
MMYNALKKKSSQHEKNFHKDINHDNNITSFKAILNQEFCVKDDNNDKYLNNLSIGDLNNKVKKYNTLYLENKINVLNAFDIDLINCVQQMVKRSKETNILEISNTFDAMSKVYSCRVDDIWITGNKLIKEFVSETKNKKLVKENEIKTKQKYRKKLMLTTADKLCCKETRMLPKKMYLNVDFDSDMIDYSKPSRILINKYSNKPYWPEYNVPKNIRVNENQQETYEMEDVSFFIKNGKICPSYHKFIAECDKSTNYNDDTDMNKLDYIVTHFNQETSQFCANNSEGIDDSMEVDLIESNSGIIASTDPESSNHINKTFGRLDNLNSLSQTLLLVDTTNSSDYTFFNRKKMCYFKCSNHWNEKFKMMITDSKQKAMLIKSRIAQTPQIQPQSNVTEFQCNKSKAIQFKVNFYSDNSTILKNIKLNSGKNQCNYIKWKPRNNLMVSSDQSTIRPIRQLESCKYIHIVPNWYKNEFEELNLNTNPNTLFLFPEQNILSNSLLLDEVPVENTDYIDQNAMDIECENEEEEITTEEYPSSNSGYIDMHELKKCIMSTIKPDGEKTINISFADLLLKLPKVLTENMKENISVSVIYVALLHLCNEYSLNLESKNDEILISQNSVNNEVLE